MKALRNLFAALLLTATATTALADDYKYLTIAGDGTETSYEVDNIDRITFDATDMVLHLTDGNQQRLPLASLQRMFFTQTSSGITATTRSQSKMHFEGGMLHADIARGETISVYNMKGERVFTANRSGAYDLSQLVKGVYIVKVGTETRKVVNK